MPYKIMVEIFGISIFFDSQMVNNLYSVLMMMFNKLFGIIFFVSVTRHFSLSISKIKHLTPFTFNFQCVMYNPQAHIGEMLSQMLENNFQSLTILSNFHVYISVSLCYCFQLGTVYVICNVKVHVTLNLHQPTNKLIAKTKQAE